MGINYYNLLITYRFKNDSEREREILIFIFIIYYHLVVFNKLDENIKIEYHFYFNIIINLFVTFYGFCRENCFFFDLL